jgi:hypothetical protein
MLSRELIIFTWDRRTGTIVLLISLPRSLGSYCNLEGLGAIILAAPPYGFTSNRLSADL